MVPGITLSSRCRAGGAMPEKDDDAKKPASETVLDQRWKLQVFYLCFYGFMTQIRPGESFITPYLLGADKNFTQAEVTNVITPVMTYSYMAVLVPIFLLTDYLRYKPVLVLQSLSHISIWLLLVLGTSVLAMQLMEFFYSVTMAARIAYSSYIFSLVTPSRYQRMASYSRSAVLLGVFTSSVLGQLCVTLGGVSFLTLNYVSLGFVSFGLILTLFLDRPQRSLFFNRPEGAAPTELDKMAGGDGSGGTRGWREAVLCRMLREVGALAEQPQLQLWSLWWVFNSAGYYLMLYYVQILWNEIYPTTDNRRVYNGGVDAASTLLGAGASLAAGYVKIRWRLWSELVIGVVTAFQAGLLLLMNTTSNIWLCYAAYVLFRSSYQFLVPLAIFQIATSLSKELCALVFGVNTFFATVLKTIITIIVADKRGLGLSVHPQFYVYFGYFTLLAVVYLVAAICVGIQHSRHKQLAEPALPKEPCQLVTEVPAQEKSLKAGAM
ncbi:reduced folate transporter [Harpia harpyja]|uniref:reduced folate transporter n=1 Tax=Harpia harpyja TaxID=202280 RepID=UPI0022B1487C|nr:reduced folate transporter [Harpia harpyja]XP_052648531.1 reduced folate transporter [Harpia harpyja]XP_052648532.1 reduced folate transporter [Harpia harpyja]XP_052648533.1 reduced folate transporter [Harpia harpyja]XP_052648534.1 reduced folate transporter [Harpia harpyja]